MGSPMTEENSVNIVLESSVYLVGTQMVNQGAVDEFLRDHEVIWETDTEVGGERLGEVAGRLCYMSFGKGRKPTKNTLGTSSAWDMAASSNMPCGILLSPG